MAFTALPRLRAISPFSREDARSISICDSVPAAAFGEEWAAEHAGEKYTGTLLNRVEEDGAMLWNVRYGDEDCVTDESFFDDGDEPGRLRRRKSPPKPVETSLAGALADDRWDACEKWTFAHASAPYPSAEDKAALARKTGWPPGSVDHWFSNMRKRKYLKLRDGTRAPRDAFEAQLYHFIRRGADADASP